MQSMIREALSRNRVMPVLVVPELEMAEPLALALASGGLTVFEVTLRTPCALEAMTRMKEAVPEALIGAGTVTDSARMLQAKQAGADFAVSPGTTPSLWAASQASAMPLLPGFTTASEAMHLMQMGSAFGKFFPAEVSGGLKALSALAGPLPDFVVCPTGGITQDSAPDYLALSTVLCVGGSWIAPASLLQAGDYAEIESRARHAAGL